FRGRGKPALNEIYPRGVGGREVQMKAWPLAQPAVNARRLVAGVFCRGGGGFRGPVEPPHRRCRGTCETPRRWAAMTATDDRPRLEIGTELTISPPKARELRDVTIRVVRPVSDSSRTSASRSVLYRVLA